MYAKYQRYLYFQAEFNIKRFVPELQPLGWMYVTAPNPNP